MIQMYEAAMREAIEGACPSVQVIKAGELGQKGPGFAVIDRANHKTILVTLKVLRHQEVFDEEIPPQDATDTGHVEGS